MIRERCRQLPWRALRLLQGQFHNLIKAANSVTDKKSRTDDFEQKDRLEKNTLTS